jgi:hypothetical protein
LPGAAEGSACSEGAVSQRVLGLALGYEALNDHLTPRLDLTLRLDPLLAAVMGKGEPKGQGARRQALAGPQ